MKNKLLSLALLVMFTCFTMDAAGFFKEYMKFRGKLGDEKIAGAIAMTKSRTYGNYLYYDYSIPTRDLDATSCKSIGKGKYQITFKVELDGENQGTWTIIFDSIKRTITGTMKEKNGKTLKIDLHEWR